MFARSRIGFALALAGTGWLGISIAQAGEAKADWQRVVELDAGPKATPTTQQEARKVSIAHLAAQEKALRTFLATHPEDEHAFEAQLRLARLLQIRAGLENAEPLRKQAWHILEELSKSATGEQRVEVDFARITYQMRAMRTPARPEREQLLLSIRRFQAEHPTDRRLPRLLAEVANIFDAEPETKRGLLTAAQGLAQDDELKFRVADDLKRLDLLEKPVTLKAATAQGKAIDLEDSRGKVVVLVFFAEWSPPSLEAITKVQRTVHDLPKERVQVLGVSLDNKAENLAKLVNKQSITWPICFDGKGWDSPVVRAFGVNTLPTVWLIDQRGRLRSLNALESTADQVSKLLRNPPKE